MARQKNNFVMNNTRGMFGGQVVFKKRAGRRYVSAPPTVDDGREATPNQKVARDRFKRSIEWAAEAVKTTALRKAYKAVAGRGQSAQNMAFRDAYHGPEVVSIISQGYTGAIGNIIVVNAKDNFKVTAVKVSIRNSLDELIEEGPAAPAGDESNWVYVTTAANANIAGTKINASAYDVPENEGVCEVTV